MAKKPKSEDVAEAAQAAPVKNGGRKNAILFGVLGLFVLGGAAGGYFVSSRANSDGAEVAKPAKPVAFMEMREMVINLAAEPNQERQRSLKFRAALEVSDTKVAAEVRPMLPRVEDAFQVFARELRASDLDGSGGLYRLREELLRRVNIAVYPAKVDAVLFKDLVVQ